MKYKELKLQYDSLWKRYESLGEAIERITTERDNLVIVYNNLQGHQKRIQAQNKIREDIINKEIEKMNLRHNQDLERIKELEIKINGDKY